jgi:hypothetical protein
MQRHRKICRSSKQCWSINLPQTVSVLGITTLSATLLPEVPRTSAREDLLKFQGKGCTVLYSDLSFFPSPQRKGRKSGEKQDSGPLEVS